MAEVKGNCVKGRARRFPNSVILETLLTTAINTRTWHNQESLLKVVFRHLKFWQALHLPSSISVS